MRILLATDAWEPQVNGVVRTLTRTIAECRAMGHQVDVISPDQFKTFPLPMYPEIKLAMGAYEPIQDRFKSFEPEAIHIATEGQKIALRNSHRLFGNHLTPPSGEDYFLLQENDMQICRIHVNSL